MKLWEELPDEINKNPFGLGNKIVMKKLRAKNPAEYMDKYTMKNIVEK